MLNPMTLAILCSLPAVGALPVWWVPTREYKTPRTVALIIMLAVLALVAGIFASFDGSAGTSAAAINLPWIESAGIRFHLAVDGLNLPFVILTALLFPVVLAATWSSPTSRNSLFLALMLILEAGLLGTFLSQNLFLFFVFWEAVLIPMTLMIVLYGKAGRQKAGMCFFLYTLAGSILLLAAVILPGVAALQQTGSWNFEFSALAALHLDYQTQLFIFVAVILACAIKCPLFPFHSWLPLAYGEAPAAGSALMAGALSKMGAFGLLKLALPLAPLVVAQAAPWLVLWGVLSILYGAILALRQTEVRPLIAYASLSHMGYLVLGIFGLNAFALQGAYLQIVSHGVLVAGLFLYVAMAESRLKGGDHLQGLAKTAPRLALLLMLLILASVALPMTSGFTAEFLILLGAFQQGLLLFEQGNGVLQLVAVALAATGMVLGAGYLLRFARTALFAVPSEPAPRIADLGLRETLALIPILLIVLWIGLAPGSFLSRAGAGIDQLLGSIPTQPHTEVAHVE